MKIVLRLWMAALAMAAGSLSSHSAQAGWGSYGGGSYGSGYGSGGYAANYGSSGGYAAGYGSSGGYASGYGSSGGYAQGPGPLRRLASKIHNHFHRPRTAGYGSYGGSSGYAGGYGSSGYAASGYGSSGSYGSYGAYSGGSSGGRTVARVYRTVSYGSTGSSYGSAGSSYGSTGSYGYSSPSVSYGSVGSTSYGSVGSSSYGSVGSSYSMPGYSTPSYSTPTIESGYGSSGSVIHGSSFEGSPIEYGSSGVLHHSGSIQSPSTSQLLVTKKPSVDASEIHLTVNVPENAIVYVNGNKTTSTGETRHYVSRGVDSKSTYRFELRAEFDRNGKTITESKTIVLAGGETEQLAFSLVDPDEAVVTALTLHVPEGAKVMLAGRETKTEGDTRTYRTRDLKKGESWDSYTIQVALDGKVKEQTIRMIGGDELELSFDFANDDDKSRLASK